ncbi:Arm DNA-binding domain-containing protein [Mesorhizobium sp. NBSH29]|uniref:Arm DNA-binding domain-containing protein n=1 Tax=Mesorhizobium sp. NBSH29 TaxID=2654249 RepID=UPI001896A1D0
MYCSILPNTTQSTHLCSNFYSNGCIHEKVTALGARNGDFRLNTSKAKGHDRPYRKTDGGGLYVIIRPNGAKWWRFDYTVSGTRKTMSLGTYPNVSLADARSRRDELKKHVAAKIDPITVERERKTQESPQSVTRLVVSQMTMCSTFAIWVAPTLRYGKTSGC